ncbi:medium-chain acyl-CoA ligase ACSF2, mitochondrial-like isoform X1 [Periplaneta americana]|uniref:medium-chain acyl-CoA ligase ACSF2, mitochondrial-like isoform X1 n=1 Tax=Periplaneta americana TaxID=6978 RepID=UPI0037E93C7A
MLQLWRHRLSVSSCLHCYKSFTRRLSVTEWRCAVKASYLHYPGDEPLSPLTTGQLVEKAAEQWGDREALVSVHEGVRFNFEQAKQQGDRLAAGLIGMGLKPGDRVAIWGPNTSQWYLTFVAAARAGFIIVNINPAYQTSELHYCLAKVGVKALIAPETFKTQKYHEMVMKIAPELQTCAPGQLRSENVPDLTSLIVISDNKLPGAYRFRDVMDSATPEQLTYIQQLQSEINADDGTNLQFTSGTTGQPKATLLSHHNTVNNVLLFGKRLQLFLKEHRICLQVPLFHVFGNVLGLLSAFSYGATIVLPSASFNAKESLKAIQQERCTIVYGTPTMFVDMLTKAGESNYDTSSLEMAVAAGAPIFEELVKQLRKKLKLKKFYIGYGMTETSPLSFASLSTDPIDKVGTTVGYIMEHVEAKVVDDKGKSVPFGTPGELWIRGYLTMLGYWNDDKKTEETIGRDKWLKTGDQFILQENGYGKIVGRIKDMIIRGGENIFPKEIEEFLEKHPDILEAQVIGVPDYRMGEEVCACLRLVEGSKLTTEQVKEYCKGKISHFKIPRYIHFLTNFPKTVSGKIQKFQLQKIIIEKEKLSAENRPK